MQLEISQVLGSVRQIVECCELGKVWSVTWSKYKSASTSNAHIHTDRLICGRGNYKLLILVLGLFH